MTDARRCPNCGSESPPRFKFCGECGQRLESAPPGLAHGTSLGERRLLTVLFCDIVESAVLADRLDPEDWREVLHGYHEACGAVIHRYGGYTAQILGDGLLIYFGYPTAQEADARRAVMTALAVAAECAVLDERLSRERGLRFAVRMGIHTGPVVAGDVAVGASRERLAVGQTPNVAARLQGLAAPSSILISGSTYQSVGAFFECDALGSRTLKGVEVPIDVFRVQRTRKTAVDDAEIGKVRSPMVARAAELEALVDAFGAAASGRGCGVLITGEAGVGKSRLMAELRHRLAGVPHRFVTMSASLFGQHSAFDPVIACLQRLFSITGREPATELMAALDRHLRPLDCAGETAILAHLVSARSFESIPAIAASPQRQREQTLAALVKLFVRLADERPLVVAVEDLHYADPSTIELVGALLPPVRSEFRMLIVATARPAFAAPWDEDAMMHLALAPLVDDDVLALIRSITADRRLPSALERRLVDRADGNPLFAEELTKSVLDADAQAADGAAADVAETFAVPTTLQDSLTARLDRLGEAREVAQVAAVLGRQFSYQLLRSVYQGPESRLRQGLHKLERADIVFAHGPAASEFTFKHALIQAAAYNLLLKSARRLYHRRAADAIVREFADVAERQPEVVARHYGESGAARPAVSYWSKAVERAWHRSANREGVQGLREALALLPNIDATERDALELAIQMKLGRALTAARGYPEAAVEQAYLRASELSERLGDREQGFFALDGLHSIYAVRGEMRRAAEISGRMLQAADAIDIGAFRLAAQYKRGAHHFFGGHFAAARDHYETAVRMSMEQSIDRFVTPERADVTSGVLLGGTLWAMGFPDAADRACRRAVEVARRVEQPLSIAVALVMGSQFTWVNRGNGDEAWRNLEEALALATEHDLPWWQAVGTLTMSWMAGCGRAPEGRAPAPDAAIATMQHMIGVMRAAGTRIGVNDWQRWLADALLAQGRPAEAISAIEAGLAESAATEQHFVDAELFRLRGVAERSIDRSANGVERAAGWLCRALDQARKQQARSYELRAAMSLAELRAGSRDSAAARHLLAECYKSFTEGFDTHDLRAARLVLDRVIE